MTPLPNMKGLPQIEQTGRMADGDVLLLLLPGEDHELRLILRPDARGAFYYMLLGGIYIPEVEDYPSATAEEYRQVLEGYNIFNDARQTAMTWEGALKILDEVRIPWFQVPPNYVHPSIAKHVLQAVFQRSSRSLLEGGWGVSIDAWQECIRKTLESVRNSSRA